MNDISVKEINLKIKEYFGDRYYDEYCKNPVTGNEFDLLLKLVYDCIEIEEMIGQ